MKEAMSRAGDAEHLSADKTLTRQIVLPKNFIVDFWFSSVYTGCVKANYMISEQGYNQLTEYRNI